MATCLEHLKREFSFRNFLLEDSKPQHFIQFQFGWPRVYVIWRCFGSVFSACLVITSLVLNGYYSNGAENRRKWAIYLTNWGLLALVMSSSVDLSTTLYVQLRRKDIAKGLCHEMPWYLKLTWVLYNIAMAMALVVSLLYWVLLYKGGQSFTGYRVLPLLSHGTNSIYVITNILVTSIPSRVLHFTHITAAGITYTVFTVIYKASGGTNDYDDHYIYQILDWNHPGKSVTVSVCAVLGGIAAHLLVFALALLRQKLWSLCRKKITTVITDSPQIYNRLGDNVSIQYDYHC